MASSLVAVKFAMQYPFSIIATNSIMEDLYASEIYLCFHGIVGHFIHQTNDISRYELRIIPYCRNALIAKPGNGVQQKIR